MKNEAVPSKGTYKSLLKELQSKLTILYVLGVGIGMLFNYQKYDRFGINIFDYSDLIDFVVAPFSDLRILFFALISLMVAIFLLKIDDYLKNRFPGFYSTINFNIEKRSWYVLYNYFAILIIIVFFLYVGAGIYGKNSEKNIRKQSPVTIELADKSTINGILIGKTKEVLFLLDDQNIIIIPVTSMIMVIKMEPKMQ